MLPTTPEDPPPRLEQAVIAGLDALIWEPQAGVSDLDRVNAVQVLGQLRDPSATALLGRVLCDATHRARPAGFGRLLRDTALAGLLRSPLQAGPATDRLLARYYNVFRQVRRGRLERNLIFDDLPLLARYRRLRPAVLGYLFPLFALLIGGILAAEALAWVNGQLRPAGQPLDPVRSRIAELLFFLGLGLTIFNLHQILLVWIATTLGSRLPLPAIPRIGSKTALGLILAVLAAGLAVYTFAGLEQMRGAYDPATAAALTWITLLLPLLVLPCYMLAHDLEVTAHLAAPTRLLSWMATALRWISAIVYTVFIRLAFGFTDFDLSFIPNSDLADWAIALAMWPYLVYLLLTPFPVIGLLALWGYIARLLRIRAKRGRMTAG
ncbi:MAG: hypothetical protein M3Z04_25685 [Chloroflexota bacterium]|nr:hypothetical protein [Chloroflexota bacterium]